VRAAAVALVVGAVSLATAACGDQVDGAERGDALAEAGMGFGAGRASALIVGREYALLFIPTANDSDDPITLERVEVRGVSGREAAQVVGVDVELRPRRAGSYVGGGLTEIVTKPRRDCHDRRTFVPVKGHVVTPGDDPLLAVRVRALAPGTFRTASLRVFYRHGRARLYQDMGFETRLRVRRTPLRLPEGESTRFCAYVATGSRAR
jgi:hypothetical protein